MTTWYTICRMSELEITTFKPTEVYAHPLKIVKLFKGENQPSANHYSVVIGKTSETSAIYICSIPQAFAYYTGDQQIGWTTTLEGLIYNFVRRVIIEEHQVPIIVPNLHIDRQQFLRELGRNSNCLDDQIHFGPRVIVEDNIPTGDDSEEGIWVNPTYWGQSEEIEANKPLVLKVSAQSLGMWTPNGHIPKLSSDE